MRSTNQSPSHFAESSSRPDASPYLSTATAVPSRERTGERSFSLESARAIARQRLATLLSFQKLAKSKGNVRAAAQVGASVGSLWRWRKAYERGGLPALQPKAPSGGRRSVFALVKLSSQASREVERLTAEHGSRRAGWQQFAGSPLCSPILARYIRKHGHAPARLADVGRVQPVQARCYISADGRRLLVCLPGHAMLSTPLAIPAGVKLISREVR